MDFLGLFGTAWNIIIILIGVGFLIFIHELGHFLFAKKAGVRVHAFSLGFGPAIFSTTKGGTEYRVGIIPLGGYVKMAGETILDENTGSEDELTSKSAWDRFQIFIAGIMMNLIVAVPIFALVYLLGIHKTEPVVGSVSEGSIEQKAGVVRGDKLVSVDGHELLYFEDYREYMMLHPKPGVSVPLVVERNGEQQNLTMSEIPKDYSAPGIAARISSSVAGIAEGSWAEAMGLLPGDSINKVNGEAIDGASLDAWTSVEGAIKSSGGSEITMEVTRDEKTVSLKGTVGMGMLFPSMVEMVEARIGKVADDYPAEAAGLQVGDVITSVDGTPIPSWKALTETLTKHGGKEVEVTYLREGQEQKATVGLTADGKIGIGLDYPAMAPVMSTIPADLLIAEGSEKPQAGDKIANVVVDGASVSTPTWEAVIASLDPVKPDQKVIFQVVREGATSSVDIELAPKFEPFVAAIKPANATMLVQLGVGPSLVQGFKQTWQWIAKTIVALKQLVTGAISAKNLAGPAGIAHISYKVVSGEEISKFLLLLGIITVNLAIVNLIPLPILDGGHILFLIVEKIKGSPVSENTFVIAQYIGLAMILLMVVFVTFNDITRIFGS